MSLDLVFFTLLSRSGTIAGVVALWHKDGELWTRILPVHGR